MTAPRTAAVTRTRRSLLFAGVAALAGCSSGGEGTESPTGNATPGETPTATRTPTPGPRRLPLGDAVDVGGGSVAAADVAVRKSVAVRSAGGVEAVGRADGQYVVATLALSGVDPSTARDRLALDVDGQRHDPADHELTTVDGRPRVAFPVGVDVDPEAVAVVWTGGRPGALWPLPEAVRAELASPPTFDVRGFSVADTDDPELVPASIRVWNRGEVESTFVATVGVSGAPEPRVLRRDIGADVLSGYSTFLSLDVRPAETATVVLDWGYGRRTDTVTVTEA